MIVLAVVSEAVAHLPHDVVYGLAAPPDLGSGGWWAPVYGGVVTSDTRGAAWSTVGGEFNADTLVGAAWVDATHLALIGADSVWWTEDGARFVPNEVRGVRTAAAFDGALWLAGTFGVVVGPDPASPVVVERGSGTHLQASSFGVAAVGDFGVGFGTSAEDWRVLPSLRDVRAAAVGAEAVWAGDGAGGVWVSRGSGWQRCGVLPVPAPIVRLADGGGTLWVATEDRGPFRSDDGCATFTDETVASVVLYDEFGGALSPDEAFPVLVASGDRVVVGGWAGLMISEDRGTTWTYPELVPPDFTRSVAVPVPWDGRTFFVGANGAGVMRTFDGGQTFDAPAHGLTSPNVQSVVGRPGRPDEVWAIVGHTAHLSNDGGETWGGEQGPFATVAGLTATESDVWMIAFDPGIADGTVARLTSDGSFQVVDALVPVFGAASPVAVDAMGSLGWCACGGGQAILVCAQDPDGPWEELWRGPGAGGVRALGGDPLHPDALAVPHEDGVDVSDDLGRNWSRSWTGGRDVPSSAARGSSGWWVGTHGGRLLRSVDGGHLWLDIGVQVPAVVRDLLVVPDDSGTVIVSTTGGVFALPGGEPPLVRWGAVQRVAARSNYIHCYDCLRTTAVEWGVESSRADLDLYAQLAPDRGVFSTLRGRTITVYGRVSLDGSAVVRVDGSALGRIAGPRDGALVSVAVPAVGPHLVEVLAVGGSDVLIDTIEGQDRATRTRSTPPDASGAPAGGCGSGGLAVLGVVGLGPVRRRRR